MSLPVSFGVAKRLAVIGVTFASVFVVVGCVNTLPPAATPDAIVPNVDTSAPVQEGQGVLVVDVVDGPIPVKRVRMNAQQIHDGQGNIRFRFSESPEPLCAASPCVANLPLGNILLGFPVLGKKHALEIELVHIGSRPTVYRRSLSWYDGHTGATRVLGIIATSVGAGAAITGIVLLPIGLDGNDRLAAAGGITLGVGAALMWLGIWAIRADSPTYRAGSSLHFSLEDRPR